MIDNYMDYLNVKIKFFEYESNSFTPSPDIPPQKTCTSFHTSGPEALRGRSSEKGSAGFFTPLTT
nr:hypothetical protein [Pedobacter sp. ASV19]